MLRHGAGIPASGRKHPVRTRNSATSKQAFTVQTLFGRMPYTFSVTSVACTGTARLKRFPRPAGSHTDCLSRYCITFSARRQVFFRIRQTRSFFQSRGGLRSPHWLPHVQAMRRPAGFLPQDCGVISSASCVIAHALSEAPRPSRPHHLLHRFPCGRTSLACRLSGISGVRHEAPRSLFRGSASPHESPPYGHHPDIYPS